MHLGHSIRPGRRGCVASSFALQLALISSLIVWVWATAATAENRTGAEPATEPAAEASGVTEQALDPSPSAGPSDEAAARRAAPPILPKELAPRTLPEADGPIPPSKAAARPGVSPVAKARKKPKSGAPVEIGTGKDDFKARIGSQAASGGGVVGRYDGLMASKALGDSARLNLVGGFPLVPNAARFDPNRSFYELSLAVSPFEESLTGRIFGVEQRIDAQQERHAIGGELGFDHARGFGLVTVDYDVDVRNVGMLSLLASTKLDSRTTVNAFADARRYTNGQTAYSALQSQPVASLQQFLDALAQTEIRVPTFASGVQTRTVAVGASRQLTERLQLAGDVTLKNVLPDSTAAQPAAPPVGQVDYAVRATWKDLVLAQSSTTAGLRIAELADSRRYSGSIGGQYPILQSLRVGPDLAFELAEGQERWGYKPSMRFEYLQSRLRLEFQLGLEIGDVGQGRAAADRTGVFYKVGYRYEF